jgi:hypothetical protein
LSQALDGSALPLALIVAGAWLSNAPVGVMASYLLAFVALVAAVKARSWVSVLRAGVGAALGLGLSAAYLIPAAHQQRWVSISQATDDPGERIENSFLFGHHADAALALHDVELHRVSLLAVSMLLLALVGFVVAWKRGYFSIAKKHREKHPSGAKAPESFEGGIGTTEVVPCYKTGGESRISRDEFSFTKEKQRVYEVPAAESAYLGQGRWWLVITLLPLAILLLQLPISLPVWNLLPKLRFLQFPWRWLVCLEAPMGILVAAAIWPARRWTRVAVVVLCAVVLVGATAFTARSFYQVCDDEDSVPGMLTAYHSGAGFVGTDEYAPLGADNTLAASGLPAACLVSDPTTPLGEAAPSQEGGDAPTPVWKPEQGACEPIHLGAMESFPRPEYWHFAATTPHAGYLILRLRSYPAWRIKLNGRIVSNLPRRDDGLIAIPVSQGPVELTVDWTLTSDQLLGRWLSLLAVLLFAGLWILERRHSRRHLS